VLKPVDSPVVRREGDKSKLPPDQVVTAGDWVQARYNTIEPTYKKRREGKDIDSRIIQNIEIKTYS
jgi:hypothetical protein